VREDGSSDIEDCEDDELPRVIDGKSEGVCIWREIEKVQVQRTLITQSVLGWTVGSICVRLWLKSLKLPSS